MVNTSRHKLHRILLFVSTLFVLVLIFLLFRSTALKLIQLNAINDKQEIREFIRSKGIMGYASIVFIEAIQMVVVLIPAEFIQLAAGVSFHPLSALMLCDMGVCLGATLIYFLVNVLKFDRKLFENASSKIDLYASKNKGMRPQILMYLLFIMPVVPFGAICYYGAGKMPYSRYLLTCATGVIPSILSSIVLGNAILYFATSGVPIALIVLIILSLMVILWKVVRSVLIKKNLIEQERSPDSLLYLFLLRLLQCVVTLRFRVKIDKDGLKAADGPVILLSNHVSFYDMYYLCRLIYPRRAAIICNQTLMRNPVIRKAGTKVGAITKKLFYPDSGTIRKTMQAVKDGHSVLLFPEGRLSLDGTPNPIVPGTGKLIKKLGLPMVIAHIDGGYLVNPKWRKRCCRGRVSVSVRALISKEEIQNSTPENLELEITRQLAFNDFAYARENSLNYPLRRKAEGLENILHRCPRCWKEYTLTAEGSRLTCGSCGAEFTIGDDYSFLDNPEGLRDVHDFYEAVVRYEKEHIDETLPLSTAVRAVRMDKTDKKKDLSGTGICTLTKDAFSYDGTISGEEVHLSLPLNRLEALAFSAGKEFECYDSSGNLLYFYPENPKSCVKWAMIVDFVNRPTA